MYIYLVFLFFDEVQYLGTLSLINTGTADLDTKFTVLLPEFVLWRIPLWSTQNMDRNFHQKEPNGK